MNSMRDRAKDHFPSVLLTFLSIIQALALEFWWSSMRQSEYLWSGGWDAWIGWAQFLAVLLGILEIWLVYTSLVMRFVWLPGFQDSVLPFVIGIIEFSLVDLMGPDHLPAWFCVLGVIFVVMIGSSHQTFIQARREPENDNYFHTVERATAKDFISQALTIAVIFAMGLVLKLTGNRESLAFACVALCVGFLALQVDLSRRFWNKSMSHIDA